MAPPKWASWTPKEVAQWLRDQNILDENVLANVEDQDIDGVLLHELDTKAWRELGVSSSLQQAKLRNCVRLLVYEWKHSISTGRLHLWPGVNLVYDLLFDGDPPSAQALSGALEALALVAALFLTIVTQFGSSVDYQEVRHAQFAPPATG
jgi:hypothetical protein